MNVCPFHLVAHNIKSHQGKCFHAINLAYFHSIDQGHCTQDKILPNAIKNISKCNMMLKIILNGMMPHYTMLEWGVYKFLYINVVSKNIISKNAMSKN
jgi:hypothetical protein